MTGNDNLLKADVLILGGGVVGLSLAREMAGQGQTTMLVDRNRTGRAASWAGAGILPPACSRHARHPIEKIAAESFRMHAGLAESLLQETGIDNGFRRCGAAFVARSPGEQAALAGQCGEWKDNGVTVEQLTRAQLVQRFPGMAEAASGVRLAVLLPDEVQIRNPDHLQALVASCRQRKVRIMEQVGKVTLETAAGSINRVCLETGQMVQADKVCICAGAWSADLLEQLDCRISTLPVRGQMLLYRLSRRSFSTVLYEGTRYIVPRDDGHVLCGSTLEQAGFDPSTTPQALADLQRFASSLLTELKPENRIDAWAGLRPGTWDGFPYLGPVPGIANAWAACGHFRSGLLSSPATAVALRQLMLDQPVLFDLVPFRLDRG